MLRLLSPEDVAIDQLLIGYLRFAGTPSVRQDTVLGDFILGKEFELPNPSADIFGSVDETHNKDRELSSVLIDGSLCTRRMCYKALDVEATVSPCRLGDLGFSETQSGITRMTLARFTASTTKGTIPTAQLTEHEDMVFFGWKGQMHSKRRTRSHD